MASNDLLLGAALGGAAVAVAAWWLHTSSGGDTTSTELSQPQQRESGGVRLCESEPNLEQHRSVYRDTLHYTSLRVLAVHTHHLTWHLIAKMH